jgi:AcrR family transcriptional regulator
MPKTPMTTDEIDIFKQRILDTAVQLITSEGFNKLSMRKIASRLNISATTIYNYYANKDELNLNIRIRGFELLYERLKDNRDKHNDIIERFTAMIRTYIEFGISFPDYYDIMFNLHTPKYLDYVGTDIEPTALHEKENALKCMYIFLSQVNGYLGDNHNYDEKTILNIMMQFWSDIHGIITLYNSRVLHEVTEYPEDFLEWRISGLADSILSLKSKIDAGDSI